MSVNLSVTDVMFGFYKNQLIIGKSCTCISKFKYGKHPNLLYRLVDRSVCRLIGQLID